MAIRAQDPRPMPQPDIQQVRVMEYQFYDALPRALRDVLKEYPVSASATWQFWFIAKAEGKTPKQAAKDLIRAIRVSQSRQK